MAKTGPSCHVTRTDLTGATIVRLSGIIDESFDKSELWLTPGAALVIDLDEVKRITSYGIREWINALKTLEASYLGFIRCRPSLVAQFNMVASFGGRGELLTFYAPYRCTKCGADTEVLIDRRKQHAELKGNSLPPVSCPGCGAPAELDDDPDSYFAFAAAAPPPNPPAVVLEVLSGAPSGKGALKVEKQVEDTITALWLSGQLDAAARLRRQFDGLEGRVVIGLKEVRAATPAGIEQLAPVLEDAALEVFLVEVSPQALQALRDTPGGAGKASVLSFAFDYACDRNHLFRDRVVGASQLRAAMEGKPDLCPQCAEPLQPRVSASLVAAAAAMESREPPPEVTAFLRRPRGRTPSGAAMVTPALPPAAPGSTGATGPDATPAGHQFGRYQLLRPIGAGGMAEVFLARQTGMGGFEKQVVVKRILQHLSQNEAFIEMFLQEARVAARIWHPNVVQIFDVGQIADQYFMAMEYVPGWDLNTVLRACTRLRRPVPLGIAARIIADVCAGLHAAHTCTDEQGNLRGVIHRDVSPHNVLVSTDGQVKISDFGIAKVMADGQSSLTPSSTLKGKLTYMSPEQVRPTGKALDARADLFAATLIFYQLLSLDNPFKRDTEYETLYAILNTEIPALKSALTDRQADVPETVGEKVDQIVRKGLAREREDRYPTAKALQIELEQVLALLPRRWGTEEVAAFVKEVMDAWGQGVSPAGQGDGEGAPSLSSTVPTAAEGPPDKR